MRERKRGSEGERERGEERMRKRGCVKERDIKRETKRERETE